MSIGKIVYFIKFNGLGLIIFKVHLTLRWFHNQSLRITSSYFLCGLEVYLLVHILQPYKLIIKLLQKMKRMNRRYLYNFRCEFLLVDSHNWLKLVDSSSHVYARLWIDIYSLIWLYQNIEMIRWLWQNWQVYFYHIEAFFCN